MQCLGGIGVLAFWLIVMGLFAMWASATSGIRRWPILTFNLKVCDAIFLSTGLTLPAAGAWLLLTGRKHRVAASGGAAAAGIWSGLIPCDSPGWLRRNLAFGGGNFALAMMAGKDAQRAG